MKMKITMLCLLVAGLTNGFAQVKKTAAPKGKARVAVKKTVAPTPTNTSNEGIFAEIDTDKGKIVIQLEYKKTPITVANFISLAEGTNASVTDEKLKGKPFYNGLKFHRVIADFMIQGGDPAGNGSGGPGYALKDEIVADLKHNRAGVLSMANSGPKTNGSQFFITHKDTPWLDGKHTVFGHVTSGLDIVDKIVQDDIITSVKIIRVGKEAKKFNAEKTFADYFVKKEAADKLAVEKQKEAKEKALKEFSNAASTPIGLKYIVLQEGTGNKPVATSNVKVHYTGMFLDGKVFDSSVQRGQTIDFGLNQVIKGWTEGVQLMPEGSKYKFYIPYQLAYGDLGAGGVIPPKADLIFEVELLKINTK